MALPSDANTDLARVPAVQPEEAALACGAAANACTSVGKQIAWSVE